MQICFLLARQVQGFCFLLVVNELSLLSKNEFDLYENEPVGGAHFDMSDFARRLVLTRDKLGNSKMAHWVVTTGQCNLSAQKIILQITRLQLILCS